MKKLTILIAIISVYVMTGCATTSPAIPYDIQGQFDEDTLKWRTLDGFSTIYGNSFIRDNLAIQPGPHTCAGFKVDLLPVNEYFEEVLLLHFDNLNNSFWSRNAPRYDYGLDPTAAFYGENTTCDSAGNFEFYSLPKGSYWIITGVSYEGGPFRTFPPSWKGGWLLKKVKVDGKNDKRVVISR